MIKNFRMRKYISRVLLPFFTAWICWIPSQAYAGVVLAFAPPAVSLVGVASEVELAAATAAGSTAGAGAVAGLYGLGAASLLGVGAMMGYLIVDSLTGDLVRIPLTVKKPVPPPFASSLASPVPIFTFYCSYSGVSSQGVSGSDCVNNLLTLTVLGNWYVLQSATDTDFFLKSKTAPFSVIQGVMNSGQTSVACPSGYSQYVSGSNGVCTLVDARLAVKDNSRDFSRNLTAYEKILADADKTGGEVVVMPSGGLYIHHPSKTGGHGHTQIIPTPDGGSQVQIQQPVTNAVGDTGLQTNTLIISPEGVVSANTQTTTGQQLSLDSAGLPVISPAPVGSTFSPSQSSSTSPVVFPSDYARQGEAASASDGVKTRLDTLHKDLSTPATATPDPELPLVADMPNFDKTFTNLLGWNLPGHSSTCPTPTLDLSGVLGPGKVFVMSSHCTLINNHFQKLQAAMMAVWSMLALFLVLRA